MPGAGAPGDGDRRHARSSKRRSARSPASTSCARSHPTASPWSRSAFNLEKDGNVGGQEVRERVDGATFHLPRGIDPPVVEKIAADATPVIAVILSGDASLRELTEFADKVVEAQPRHGRRASARPPSSAAARARCGWSRTRGRSSSLGLSRGPGGPGHPGPEPPAPRRQGGAGRAGPVPAHLRPRRTRSTSSARW